MKLKLNMTAAEKAADEEYLDKLEAEGGFNAGKPSSKSSKTSKEK